MEIENIEKQLKKYKKRSEFGREYLVFTAFILFFTVIYTFQIDIENYIYFIYRNL